MDNFLDRYHISKLNQDCTNDTNKSKTLKEIDTVIKSLSHKKSPGQMVSEQKSIRISKKS